jgi:hypothetical protein
LAKVKTNRTEINHIHKSSLLTVQLEDKIGKIADVQDGEQIKGKVQP